MAVGYAANYGVPKTTAARAGGFPLGQAAGGGTTNVDFRSILAKLAEELKPGGSIEKSYMSDIEKEGKQLGAQLEAGSISRGLGNARTGIPTSVFNKVSSAKQKLRSDMTSQYMGVLQNLASLALQQEQGDANRAASEPSMASQGLSATGKPLHGSLAEAQLNMALNPVVSRRPSATATPSLYAAGGYGAGTQAGDAYASLTAPLFGGGDTGGAAEHISWDQPMYGNIAGTGMGELEYLSKLR
jgi:hypothetical protein